MHWGPIAAVIISVIVTGPNDSVPGLQFDLFGSFMWFYVAFRLGIQPPPHFVVKQFGQRWCMRHYQKNWSGGKNRFLELWRPHLKSRIWWYGIRALRALHQHHETSQFLGWSFSRCFLAIAEDLKEDHHGASESHGGARILKEIEGMQELATWYINHCKSAMSS